MVVAFRHGMDALEMRCSRVGMSSNMDGFGNAVSQLQFLSRTGF